MHRPHFDRVVSPSHAKTGSSFRASLLQTRSVRPPGIRKIKPISRGIVFRYSSDQNVVKRPR